MSDRPATELQLAAAQVSSANTTLLALGTASFLLAPLCTVMAWASALRAAGVRLGTLDACARYGVGSPLALACAIVPALALAGLLPLTPGSFGVAAQGLPSHSRRSTNGPRGGHVAALSPGRHRCDAPARRLTGSLSELIFADAAPSGGKLYPCSVPESELPVRGGPVHTIVT